MDERLLERESNKKYTKNYKKSQYITDSDNIIFDSNNMNIYYNTNKTINNTKDNTKDNINTDNNILLITIDELLTITDIREYINNTNNFGISDVVIDDILEFKHKLQSIKSDDLYKVDYRKRDDILEFYVPLNTNISDDIIIKKIYDEHNNFQAEDIEEQLDIPLYKLETKNLYCNKLDGDNIMIYHKNDIIGLSNKLNYTYEKLETNNRLLKSFLITNILIGILYSKMIDDILLLVLFTVYIILLSPLFVLVFIYRLLLMTALFVYNYYKIDHYEYYELFEIQY